ncbi:MAG: RNA polymerase sigma factor SigJ [Acidimicrobiales bacterium]
MAQPDLVLRGVTGGGPEHEIRPAGEDGGMTPERAPDPVAVFQAERPRLTGIAYALCGQVMDAEDVVQDAWLRWQGVADRAAIVNPAAWLTTVVSRLALDRLRSARNQRETYVGPWLPEPLVTATALVGGGGGPGPDPGDVVAEAERLSLAFLAAVERLNPVERAVLLLREVFDLDYADIAEVVGRTADNCRQIARRARDRVGGTGRPHRPGPEREGELAAAFFTALAGGDLDHLRSLLAADVHLHSDGGGKARAALHPVLGADRVARFLIGVTRKRQPGDRVALVRINGDPALYLQRRGRPLGVIVIQVDDGVVSDIRAVLNPDKIGHLAGLDAPIPVGPGPAAPFDRPGDGH